MSCGSCCLLSRLSRLPSAENRPETRLAGKQGAHNGDFEMRDREKNQQCRSPFRFRWIGTPSANMPGDAGAGAAKTRTRGLGDRSGSRPLRSRLLDTRKTSTASFTFVSAAEHRHDAARSIVPRPRLSFAEALAGRSEDRRRRAPAPLAPRAFAPRNPLPLTALCSSSRGCSARSARSCRASFDTRRDVPTPRPLPSSPPPRSRNSTTSVSLGHAFVRSS